MVINKMKEGEEKVMDAHSINDEHYERGRRKKKKKKKKEHELQREWLLQ